ncbi:hypothetical protein H4R33_006217 [Dimargaris cristalligena]|uniref:Vesicle transport protein n=1 Tax=Dimargaris cristalligena TaxID=215637 RepID=A0A4P9ZRU6_9FUNG|nr:hypothetical protein H4R33_006217 [Dimargaris cristalligena]RKP35180.1 vesicle transport protein [Dimargaris cristalligena]|eukprot:RKP35180.1 vesicle transport protein [Dimargaris cristalligena]
MRESNSTFRQRKYAPDDPDEKDVERLVAHHRQVQDELTDDLVRMAQALKGNSLAFKDILTQDEKALQEAQEVMGTNQNRLQQQGGRLGTYTRKSWGTTWMTWLMVLLVCLVFILMYLVIRLFPKRA